MQLVARGQQDIYLTGSAKLSYFQFVYRKHTNFAMESVHQTFLSKPVLDRSSHTIATCRIGRVADLLYDVFFSFQLPAIYSDGNLRFKWIDKVANYMIYSASVRIDTNLIDIQYGGSDTLENVRPTHGKCNLRKNKKSGPSLSG